MALDTYTIKRCIYTHAYPKTPNFSLHTPASTRTVQSWPTAPRQTFFRWPAAPESACRAAGAPCAPCPTWAPVPTACRSLGALYRHWKRPCPHPFRPCPQPFRRCPHPFRRCPSCARRQSAAVAADRRRVCAARAPFRLRVAASAVEYAEEEFHRVNQAANKQCSVAVGLIGFDQAQINSFTFFVVESIFGGGLLATQQ